MPTARFFMAALSEFVTFTPPFVYTNDSHFLPLYNGLSILQNLFQKLFPMVQKIFSDSVMVCHFIIDFFNGAAIKAQDFGIRIAKKNRRMGRDDELAIFLINQILQYSQKRQLPLRR